MTINNPLFKVLVCLAVAAPSVAVAATTEPVMFLNSTPAHKTRGMLTDAGTVQNPRSPISYGFEVIDGSSEYVAKLRLQGFLICNEFASADNDANSGIRLRPTHDAWVIGATDGPSGDPQAPKLQGSFTRVHGFSYFAPANLDVTACDADGNGAGCVDSNSSEHAALQCYMVEEDGGAVADARYSMFPPSYEYEQVPNAGDEFIFTSDFGKYSQQDNSWVRISNIDRPDNADDSFSYEVRYHLPQQANRGAPSTESLPSSDYILKQGYDQAVFSSCDMLLTGGFFLPRGQDPIVSPGVRAFTVNCDMRDWDQNFTQAQKTTPVVTAALFTGPYATAEMHYDDNVAFGFPVESDPVPTVSVSMASNPINGQEVLVGNSVTYTLTAEVDDAPLPNSLVLTDHLGTGLDFGAVTYNPDGFGQDTSIPSTVKFTLPANTPVGRYDLQFTAQVTSDAGGTIVNGVTAQGGFGVTIACSACSTSHPVAAAEVTATISSATQETQAVAVGDTIGYTIDVTVADTNTTDSVALTATLGDGLSFVPMSVQTTDGFTANPSGQAVTFTLPGGKAPGTYSVSFDATVDNNALHTPGQLANALLVAGGHDGGDNNGGMCSAGNCSVEHGLVDPVIHVESVASATTVAPGGTIVYTMKVWVTQSSLSRELRLHDRITPAGLNLFLQNPLPAPFEQQVAGGTWTLVLTMPAGTPPSPMDPNSNPIPYTVSYTVQAPMSAGNEVSNDVAVSSHDDGGDDSPDCGGPTLCSNTTTVQAQ